MFGLAQDRQADSLILVEIYNQLDGPNWINNAGWLTEVPLEEWDGIKTKETRVSELSLSNNGIKGVFPEGVYQLDALEKLKFFTGDLSGSLSTDLYNLSHLKELTIGNCGLVGTIPFRMDSLPLLERLDLQRNSFEGVLPMLPPSLLKLDVKQNNLVGDIPESYASLPMWQINVSSNAFTGSLDIVENWKTLDNFTGSFNDWDEQPLPAWLDEMPVMRSFSCTECNLTGEIPEYNWEGSPKFYQLIASSNNISGDIGNLRLEMSDVNYPWIDLNDNAFSGIIPTHKIKMVNKLYLNSNDFEGITTFEYDYLASIRFADNKFTLASLIEEFPKIIQDTNVSNYRIDNQRSPLEDTEMIVFEEETLTLEADEIVDGASYQWYYNTNPIQGATSNTFSKQEVQTSDGGRYWCEVTHPDIIDVNTELISFKGREWTVSIEMSTHTTEVQDHVIVYPNPTSDFIQIEGVDENALYSVRNIYGSLVLNGRIDSAARIDVRGLFPGTYFVMLDSKKASFPIKIVKL